MAAVLQWKSLHVLRLFHKRPKIQVKALLCKEKKHIQGKSSNTSTFAGTLLRKCQATLFVLVTIKYDVDDLQVSVLETGCKRLILWHDCVVL